MNKIIIMAVMMTFVLASGLSFAQFTPLPVPVKILYNDGNAVFDVTITNLATGEVVTGKTTNGEFLAEWANTQYKYGIGNTFRINVLDRAEEVTYTGDALGIVFFDLRDLGCPTCEICETCEEPSVCEECPAPTECPEVPEDLNWIVSGVVLLIVGLAGGAGLTHYKGSGIRIYTGRSGDKKVLHKHRFIRSYHSPSISHRTVKVRHKRGELSPKYSDNGYVG